MNSSRFDRIATGAAALAAGPMLVAGMLTSVWEADPSPAAYLRTYLVDPDRSQLSAVLLHVGFMLLLPAALGLAAVSRGAPRLRATGLVFAMLGLSTLPGLPVVDFYHLALAQTLPIETAASVLTTMEGYWGPLVLFLPTMLGMLLSFALVAAAAWRVGFLPWWSALVLIVGVGLATLVRGGGLAGAVATSAVLAVALADVGSRLIRSAGVEADDQDSALEPARITNPAS